MRSVSRKGKIILYITPSNNLAVQRSANQTFGSSLNKALKHMTEVIPDTKVCKNLTELDRNVFQAYVLSKPYSIGITPKEVEELSKFDGSEFIVQSYRYLLNKLGLKEDIAPGLAFAKLDNDVPMAYLSLNNIIAVDIDKLAKSGKKDIFALLKHEMQHMLQNYQILRHETIGEQSINAYVRKYIAETKKQIISQVQSGNSEVMEKTLLQNNNEISKMLYEAVQDVKKGKTDTLDAAMEKDGESYKNSLLSVRKLIIDNLGMIKKDSALTPKIQNYFDEYKDIGYYNTDNTINYHKYFTSKIEQEALMAQARAGFEFSQESCFMRYQKQETLNAFQNGDKDTKKIVDSLEKEAKEMKETDQ